ncbi:MAG: N-acetylmuramidase domain-containing protein [Nitratireductor sp.]
MDKAVGQAITEVANETGIEQAVLAAIVEVESGGRYSASVAGRQEPLIRFEGHYFYRLLPTVKRNRAVVSGLAHRLAGRVANPASQTARWKILQSACDIDRPAALQSTSWGVGQVMGAHWQWLGYASIDALVSDARSGVEGQVRLMARYIDKAGLKHCLSDHDWAGFARAYNGPGYRTHRYDSKMAAAFARHSGERRQLPSRHALAWLRFGSQGHDVEQLQHALRRLGHPLIADGDFGPATRAALISFQRENGLEPDGICGTKTLAAIIRNQPPSPVSASPAGSFQSI